MHFKLRMYANNNISDGTHSYQFHVPYICLEMSIEYYCPMLFATVFVSGVIGKIPC